MNKIMFINCVYGQGSTGSILKNLHNKLIEKGWNSKFLYSRGNRVAELGVVKLASEYVFQAQAFFSRLTGKQYGCSVYSTYRIKKEILKFKPDVVNLHCINANTVNVVELLNFLKRNNIPTVVTFHAEFLYTGGCAHAVDCNKWQYGCGECPQISKSFFKIPLNWWFDKTAKYWKGLYNTYKDFGCLRLSCVSPWVRERVLKSPFFNKDDVFVTMNCVDTTIFRPTDSGYLRIKHNIPENSRIYLHVTPNFQDPLKGGNYVIDFAKKLEKVASDAWVIIIGFDGDKAELPSNVIALKRTSNQNELADYYSMASATILTSKRETFSMVTAESLCCGTPVVGFKAGGPESICTKGYVAFVDYGDVEGIIQAVMNIQKPSNLNDEYSQIFSIENTADSYIKVYNSLLKQ